MKKIPREFLCWLKGEVGILSVFIGIAIAFALIDRFFVDGILK